MRTDQLLRAMAKGTAELSSLETFKPVPHRQTAETALSDAKRILIAAEGLAAAARAAIEMLTPKPPEPDHHHVHNHYGPRPHGNPSMHVEVQS